MSDLALPHVDVRGADAPNAVAHLTLPETFANM